MSHLPRRAALALLLAAAFVESHAAARPEPMTPAGLQAACDGGDAEMCALLAVVQAKGVDVPKDQAKARSLMQKACEGGYATGCYLLGGWCQEAGDEPGAARSFASACELKKVKACAAAALIHLKGKGGVARDPGRAAKLLDLGCAGGEAWSCQQLGRLLQAGDDLPKDPPRAAELMRRACEGGIARACGDFAKALAFGEGVPKDPPRAAALLGKSCDAGEPALCGALGFFYEKGIGVRPDRARAAELYERACQGGDESACRYSDALGRGAAGE